MNKMKIFGMFAGIAMSTGGTALAADAVTIKGEVIDTYCYATMGVKGESHRSCGIDCIKKGIPAAILEDGTGKVYVLLPNKDRSPLPQAVIDKVGRKGAITGEVYTIGGSQFLTVESVK